MLPPASKPRMGPLTKSDSLEYGGMDVPVSDSAYCLRVSESSLSTTTNTRMSFKVSTGRLRVLGVLTQSSVVLSSF